MHVTRQIEVALTRYITNMVRRRPLLSKVQVIEGRSEKTKSLPRCEVHCLSADYVDGFPAGAGEYKAAIAVVVFGSADDRGSKPKHDQLAQDIACMLRNQDALFAELNAPSTGLDQRSVGSIEFHEIVPSGIAESTEGRSWSTSLGYDAMVWTGLG